MNPIKTTLSARIAILILFGLALFSPINIADQESERGIVLLWCSLYLWDTPIVILGLANLLAPYLLIDGLFQETSRISLGFGLIGSMFAGLYGLIAFFYEPIFGANLFWTIFHLSSMILFGLAYHKQRRGHNVTAC